MYQHHIPIKYYIEAQIAGGEESLHDYHKVVVLLTGNIPRIAYVPPWHTASSLIMYDVD